MVEASTATLSAIRLLAAALTLVLVFFAHRAWRRSGETRMMRLMVGFALLFLSVIVEGAMFNFVAPNDLFLAHIVEAGTEVVAYGVLIWALF